MGDAQTGRKSPDDRRGVSVKAAVARTRWQQRKKIATRRTILETALRLFDDEGYASVTTQRIAAEAGMSQITLFRYFPTKEDLVIGFPADGELPGMLQRAVGERGDGESPIDVVRRMIPHVLGAVEQDQLDGLAARLRIVRSDAGLTAALYARIPRWVDAVVGMWDGARGDGTGADADDGAAMGAGSDGTVMGTTIRHDSDDHGSDFRVRMEVFIIVGCTIETLFEWSRRCDATGSADIDELTAVVSESVDALAW